MNLELVSEEIFKLVLEDSLNQVNQLINSLTISDQLSIHANLHFESLEYITKNRGKLTLSYSVFEHIVWNYYRQLPWSTEILITLIEEYKKEKFIALESIIVSAIKNNKVTQEQIEIICTEFSSKEFKRQLLFWEIRNKIRSLEMLVDLEVESLIELRGYEVLLQAIDHRLISTTSLNLLTKPKEVESDKKWKEKLFLKALEYDKNSI